MKRTLILVAAVALLGGAMASGWVALGASRGGRPGRGTEPATAAQKSEFETAEQDPLHSGWTSLRGQAEAARQQISEKDVSVENSLRGLSTEQRGRIEQSLLLLARVERDARANKNYALLEKIATERSRLVRATTGVDDSEPATTADE